MVWMDNNVTFHRSLQVFLHSRLLSVSTLRVLSIPLLILVGKAEDGDRRLGEGEPFINQLFNDGGAVLETLIKWPKIGQIFVSASPYLIINSCSFIVEKPKSNATKPKN